MVVLRLGLQGLESLISVRYQAFQACIGQLEALHSSSLSCAAGRSGGL
jgi:hypothetical protein